MAKSNEQLEDILDDLSVIKNNNVATEQRLGNIENLLAKLAAKEEVAPITPVASTSRKESANVMCICKSEKRKA